jgi:predicted nucleic acid-binding protein
VKTAIDTSVLIAIAKGEADGSNWIDLLIHARAASELVICDIVAAEFFAALMDGAKFRRMLRDLGISYSVTSLSAAQLAGRTFKRYRQQGGPREHLLPDFLIGAHAAEQADQIAAIDRGYLRRYFTRLRLISP